jgi:hypothetical protein
MILKRGRTRGLEPPSGGTTIHCLNHLATLAVHLFKYSTRRMVDKRFFILIRAIVRVSE